MKYSQLRPSKRIADLRAPRALTGATVFVAAVAASIAWPIAAHAAVACTETALVQAIDAANAAGGGNVVLTPACTYNLTVSHATGTHGPDGLPMITTVITLTGNQNVITRSSALPFRIAEVTNTGKLTLKSVTLNNGLSVGDGGGILNYGAVTLTASALTNNIAAGAGGGIRNFGAATFTGSTVASNTASGTGGGLSNADVPAPATGTTATFTGSTVSGNIASDRGGGLYNGLRGTLTTTSSFVTSNRALAALGGGIAAVNSTASTLTSTPVSANNALGAGGVYRLGGVMTITTSPITGNTPNNCVGSSPAVPGCTA